MSRRGRGDTLTLARDLAAGRASPTPPMPRRQRAIYPDAKSCRHLSPGDLTPREAQRAWFASLLYRAFPGETDSEVAKLASAELTRLGARASVRQVHYWLKLEHDPSFHTVNTVLALVGPDRIHDVVRGPE